jgi:hypothetical protein
LLVPSEHYNGQFIFVSYAYEHVSRIQDDITRLRDIADTSGWTRASAQVRPGVKKSPNQ